MSTSVISPSNIRGYKIMNMNQEWCDDFDLAGANIINGTTSRDGDIAGNAEAGDTLSSNDYCNHITDAQIDANAQADFWDTDDADKNLYVRNWNGGTGGKKAFCGIMGASASGGTGGTTVQNWTTYQKTLYHAFCLWLIRPAMQPLMGVG